MSSVSSTGSGHSDYSTGTTATSGGLLYGLNSSPSLAANDDALLAHAAQTGSHIRLTAKPHAFIGAVLSPKHALELTPTLCLQIASALADYHSTSSNGSAAQQHHLHYNQHHHHPHHSFPISSSSSSHHTNNNNSKSVVPYTVWITEAWRVLGWGEPSAALFWELATMFHALATAGREVDGHGSRIPPILSCGSTSSLGSGATSTHTTTHNNINTNNSNTNASGSNNDRPGDKKKLSAVSSAKELPVWLVGTFLLLHCEEVAYQRNLSGQDERRFYGTGSVTATDPGGKIDFNSIFKHHTLSPRTRLHASWSNDNTHCTAYLLRHLRKILLLTAVSHNHEATVACMHLAAMPTLTEEPHHLPSVTTMASNSSALANNNNTTTSRLRSSHSSSTIKKYDVNELRRQHDDEHGIVGLSVRLTMEDLERLDLVLQPLAGGGIDDPPLRMGEFLWKCLYHDPPPPTASIPLGDVEREIRQHLELELTVVVDPSGDESPEDSSSHHRRRLSEENDPAALRAMSRLTVADRHNKRSSDGGGGGETVGTTGRAKLETSNQHQKELTYTRLRGTTIVLKPNPPESSSGVSVASGDPSSSGRLHDIIVSDCSDAHFYLLQPFEHATIAACSGCTIVVGAVAGLLHVVDCDKVVITAASRRILVSNSCDVQLCIFSPSPPLLVGDYRACQFAPYNTYYDGLREDLLATGLAHAAVSDSQSPYHSNARNNDNEMAWLPLQCSSNKWRQPIEVSKLEVPQVPGSPGGLNPMVSAPLSPGADDRAMGTSGNDVSMQAPVLVPASDFSILFVPLENEAARQRRLEGEEGENATLMEGNHSSTMTSATPDNISNNNGGRESQYCRLLAEMLQLSPFRLPLEYERRALMKAERMKNIQQAVQKNLTVEQQRRFEEELNRGFRDWLVTSGNLRQVLDLVHLEIKGGV